MPDAHSQRHPSPEEQFARLVREKRESLGWSQEELARRVSAATGAPFHQTGITRIEKLSRSLRLNEVMVLASVLGINLGPLTVELSDDFQREQTLNNLLKLARAGLKLHQQDAYKMREEMDELTARYQETVERIEGIQKEIADIEESLQEIRLGISESINGE
jgi:transcriptional regulator with XRE-family HTH domain